MALTEVSKDRPSQESTITQSEVERLLAEVGGAGDSPVAERAPQNASGADDLPAERYDFRQLSSFADRELRKLRLHQEAFIRSLSSRLSAHLRLEVALQMSKLETLPFQSLVQALPSPTHLALFKLEPLQGICLMEISPRVALGIVDRELGGPGICHEDPRDLSQMETRLLSSVLEMTLNEWCGSWSDLLELRPVILGYENSGRYLQTCPPGSMMLIVSIEIRLGELAEAIQLAFPYQTLEPLMRKLGSSLELAEKPATLPAASPPKWNPVLNEVTMQVAAQLPGLQLTAKRLAQLRPGDVLPIPLGVSSRVEVRLGALPKFIANLGTCDHHWALKIIQATTPPPTATPGQGTKQS